MTWFPLSDLRHALDLIEERYPNADITKGDVGDLLVASGPADDDPEVALIAIEPGCPVDFYDESDTQETPQ